MLFQTLDKLKRQSILAAIRFARAGCIMALMLEVIQLSCLTQFV